ncbi:hypothetical protein CEUSTIGMA_g2332.t1 [Chlamydomonas eustigma]|uniref:B30.2/SPRY domain-containing protein n=1 Tax=Chlamydomonas eustigma TaxID=1157962 RepID=A0A250WVU5_9CHLO|nr:hypothetical protein CEUSTIGMA_g2332.t1 [Chlamydomonas eustigma]|eukprot:GAX74886.1 hypothetical protein CEUSTIGMA_g2332.t1 [Chlamydomonas eustigma]
MKFYDSSRYSVPSAWDTYASTSRNQTALGYLKVEGLRVKYVGPGEDDRQAATVIANHPVPMDCPLFYFEITVISRGREGFIGIGFQTEEVNLGRLPGWESHSYGYHGDDGHCFSGNGRGQPYGPKYTTGDVIGCLLNKTNQTISYYKNGTSLGVAFRGIFEERLYPCVGMRTAGEEVMANFGAQPFMADFQNVLDGYKAQVLLGISGTSLPLISSVGTPLLPQLLHDHLLHHRCPQTAAIIARDLLISSQETDEPSQSNSPKVPTSSQPSASLSVSQDISTRQLIFDLVTAGHIQEAVTELTSMYSRGPLDSNPSLDFRLKVAQFCELLRNGGAAVSSSAVAAVSPGSASSTEATGAGVPAGTDAALAFGRTVLAPHRPKGPAEEELLSDALSLLAYEDPETSPCGHLMGQATRDTLAEALNSAILKYRGLPAVSPLERIYQQAVVAVEQLKLHNHDHAVALDVKSAVFK